MCWQTSAAPFSMCLPRSLHDPVQKQKIAQRRCQPRSKSWGHKSWLHCLCHLFLHSDPMQCHCIISRECGIPCWAQGQRRSVTPLLINSLQPLMLSLLFCLSSMFPFFPDSRNRPQASQSSENLGLDFHWSLRPLQEDPLRLSPPARPSASWSAGHG